MEKEKSNTLKRRKSTEKISRTGNYGYLFVLPFFVFLFLFSLLPIMFSFGISFTKWNSYTDMQFVGLTNYITILKDGLFFKSLFNTLKIMLIALPAGVLLSLGLAFLLNENVFKFSRFFKTTYFLPYITTPVAIGLLFSLLFNSQIGFVNTVLKAMGLIDENIFWLSNPKYVVPIVGLLVLWKSFGYNMVLYLAGMQVIPKDLYEAAEIDGATTWQKFKSVTIPMLRSIHMFVIITSIIWGLQIFDEPAMLMVGANSSASIANTLGGPAKCVYTLVSYVYEEGFVLFREGTSAAVAYLMTVIIILFSIISVKIMNRGEEAL